MIRSYVISFSLLSADFFLEKNHILAHLFLLLRRIGAHYFLRQNASTVIWFLPRANRRSGSGRRIAHLFSPIIPTAPSASYAALGSPMPTGPQRGQVAIRVRPFSEQEKADGATRVLEVKPCADGSRTLLVDPEAGEKRCVGVTFLPNYLRFTQLLALPQT